MSLDEKFPMHLICETEGCVNEGKVWILRPELVQVRSLGMGGLYQMPDLRCEGCHEQPVLTQPPDGG